MLRALRVLAIACVLLCALATAVPLPEDASSTTTTTVDFDSTTTATTTPTATTTITTAATTVQGGESKYLLAADDVPTCKQSHVDLGACVQRVFEIMLPRMKDGNAELNLPALDPFTLNRTTVRASFGPVSGRVTMKRALVHGMAAMKYKKVDINVKDKQVRMIVDAYVPRLQVVGSYKADLAVNNAHMRPKGTFNISLTDIHLKTWSDSELYEKDGHRFVRLQDFDADPKVTDMKINVTGIFEDPQLNDIVVNVLNQYWREIYAALLPQTRTYWAPQVLRAVNEAMAVVPFDSYVKDE